MNVSACNGEKSAFEGYRTYPTLTEGTLESPNKRDIRGFRGWFRFLL